MNSTAAAGRIINAIMMMTSPENDTTTTTSQNNNSFSQSNKADDKSSSSSFNFPVEADHFCVALILALSFLGVVANSLNLKTFWKLRNEDPINLNLLGLAASDLLVCLTTFLLFVTSSHWYFNELKSHFRAMPNEVMYLVVGVPHSVFVRVTVLVTASVAVQRCLCVVMPLKVRGLFTHFRVIASLGVCFCLPVLMIMAPLYHVNKLRWVTLPGTNLTILRHVMTDEFYDVNVWSVTTNTFVLLVIPFITVSVCTVVMIRRLKKAMRWRLQAANSCAALDIAATTSANTNNTTTTNNKHPPQHNHKHIGQIETKGGKVKDDDAADDLNLDLHLNQHQQSRHVQATRLHCPANHNKMVGSVLPTTAAAHALSMTSPALPPTNKKSGKKSFDNPETNAQAQSWKKMSSALVEKERRLIKMVLTVSVVFLVCYAPNIIMVMFVAFTDTFNVRTHDELQKPIGYAVLLLDTLNSSINVFIYYNHSTNYRKAFRSLFGHNKR